ncbi:MAG: response regulator [Patescibacteria group bacterium]
MNEDGQKKRILIIDDDKFLLDMYSIKFSEQNFEVLALPSAILALEKIEGGYAADVMLVDIIMEKMDGFSFIKEIRSKTLCPAAAMIILSNLGQQEDVNQGRELGVDGYIIKASATPSEVVAKVEEIIKNKK